MPLESRDAKNKCIGVWNSERFGEIKCTRQKAGGKREVWCVDLCAWACVHICAHVCVHRHVCAHVCIPAPVYTHV